MNQTAVIVLHYQHEEDTDACLRSLHAEKPWYQIIVVANGTDSEKIDVWKAKFPLVHFLFSETNTGYAGGMNLGIRHARNMGMNDVILLNNDTIVPPHFVSDFLSEIEKKDEVGAASPKIYFSAGHEYHHGRYEKKDRGKVIWYAGGTLDWAHVYASHRGVDEVEHGQYNEEGETDFATGCCMFLSLDAVYKSGLFDERYFLYYEDVDLCLRMKACGYRVLYVPTAHMWHQNAGSSDRPGSRLHVYYQTRNRLMIGYTYAPWRTKKSLLLESLRMLKNGGVQKQAVIDYYIGRLGNQYARD